MQSQYLPKPNRRIADTPQTAAYLHLSRKTLEADRVRGILGIPYLKLGRAVRYDLDAVDRWMEARQRRNTSQAEG